MRLRAILNNGSLAAKPMIKKAFEKNYLDRLSKCNLEILEEYLIIYLIISNIIIPSSAFSGCPHYRLVVWSSWPAPGCWVALRFSAPWFSSSPHLPAVPLSALLVELQMSCGILLPELVLPCSSKINSSSFGTRTI